MAGMKLKNCPFCGGKAEQHHDNYGRMEFDWVICTKCRIQTAVYDKDTLTPNQFWNRRVKHGPKEHDSGPLQCY